MRSTQLINRKNNVSLTGYWADETRAIRSKTIFFYIDSQNTARLLTLTPICVWIHSLITTQNKVTLVQANNPHLFFDNPDTCMCFWLVYIMFFNLLVNFLQLCEWIDKKMWYSIYSSERYNHLMSIDSVSALHQQPLK